MKTFFVTAVSTLSWVMNAFAAAPVVNATSPAQNATGQSNTTTLNISVSDADNDALTVTYYGRRATSAPGPDFTVIGIPDTQYYSAYLKGGTPALFYAQTQWIVDQRDIRNIAFVSHFGDLVQNGDQFLSEWIVADAAMGRVENRASTLRGFGIPFGAAPGNHDQSPNGNADGTTTYYNQYFGSPRFAGRPYYGGHYGSSNDNNYQLFSASGLDFIALHLEYDTTPDQAILDWADSVLKAYPDRRAIVTSHWMVNTGNPASFSTQGQAIYDNLKDNPNLFLMLGGHVHGEGQRSDTFNGHTVYSVLADYQEGTNGGNGYLRIMEFSPANNEIRVKTYSPSLGQFETDADSQFTLSYDMQSPLGGFVVLGTANVSSGGTSSSFSWNGLQSGAEYEWYVSVSDGANTATSPARRFSVTAPVVPSVSLTAPANNSTFASPPSVTLTATASDNDNAVARVEFYRGNVKIGEDSTAPYEFTWIKPAPGQYDITAVAIDASNLASVSSAAHITVAGTSVPAVFIEKGSTWKYLDNGSDQGTAWYGPSFNDASWASGPAELGYGDDPATTVSYGSNSSAKYITTYFRKTFNVADAAAVTSLILKLQRDDGAVVYLNNVEVMRDNMPAGGITYTTLASNAVADANESAFFTFTLNAASLVNGPNTIAVEVHQISGTSTDVSFDLELSGTITGDEAPSVTFPAPAGPFTAPANITLTGTATDSDGSVAQVEFFQGSTKLGTDTTAPYSITWRNVGFGTYNDITAVATDDRGAVTVSPAVSVTVNQPATAMTLFPKGAIWRFRDNGSNQGTAWQGSSFYDGTWSSGAARLGYGGDGEVTTVSYGSDANNKYTTTYFRSEFTLANPGSFTGLALNLSRDDGAVVYLNGAEVARSNMPTGTVAYNTFASATVSNADETTYFPITLSASSLAAGRNVIAVELHQVNLTSSDLGMDLELTGTTSPGGSLTRGPYLQMATPTSMVVRWRSSASVTGRVRYGTSVAVMNQTADEPTIGTEHEVRLSGLAPATTYYYSVGTAAGTMAGGDSTYTFTTPPIVGTAANTRIWVLGDPGTATASQTAVRDAFYTFTGPRTPDLWLMLGDNAYTNGTDAEYQTAVFNIYPTMLRKSPLWPALGNHDTAQATAYVDTYPYFSMFTLPTAGEAGGVASGTEHYYSFNYGNIHFICLDSMTASRSATGAMATWLEADLAAATATWIIAFWHHPPYSKGSHDSDAVGEIELNEMRTNILPILEQGGVDLVLCGHSHSYERSFLLDGHYGLSTTLTPAMKKNAGDGRVTGAGAYLKPLTGPRDHQGAVYTVAGSSGQTSGGSLDHPAMFLSLSNLGSVVLDISGTRLDATFLRENGSAPDTYTIIKQGAADSDSDGISDEYEIAHGLDRHNAADALLDADNDGRTNRDEYILGLQSNAPDRYVFSVTTNTQSGTATITFPTQSGRNYRVLWSPDLINWSPGSNLYAGDGTSKIWVDDGSATGSPPGASPFRRFYRIEVTVPSA